MEGTTAMQTLNHSSYLGSRSNYVEFVTSISLECECIKNNSSILLGCCGKYKKREIFKHRESRWVINSVLLFSYLSQPREIWGISSFYYFHICHNQERSGESVLFIIFTFVTTKRGLGNQFFLLFSHSSQPREVWGISHFFYGT